MTPERIAELRALLAADAGPADLMDIASSMVSNAGLALLRASRVGLPECLNEIERLRASNEFRDGELDRAARNSLQEQDEIARLRAALDNREADLDAMRTELIEAKRERNAALDRITGLQALLAVED